jgi:hypothetical protein
MVFLWAVSGPAPDSPNQVVMRCDLDGEVGHSTPDATESEMQKAEVAVTFRVCRSESTVQQLHVSLVFNHPFTGLRRGELIASFTNSESLSDSYRLAASDS